MKIVVVDTETTSTDPGVANIMEVGIATADLHSGEVNLLMDSLVCPDCPEDLWRTCWFMEHARLDPRKILGAPRFEEIAPLIDRCFAVGPVTAFNLGYDWQVLKRHGVTPSLVLPCLMLLTKDILKLHGRYDDWKYPKFAEAWEYFFPNEPLEENHRAGHHAMHAARMALALYYAGYFGIPQGVRS